MSFSQSVHVYKHPSLDETLGWSSTTVKWTQHMPVLFSKLNNAQWSSALGLCNLKRKFKNMSCCLSKQRNMFLNSRFAQTQGTWSRLSKWVELSDWKQEVSPPMQHRSNSIRINTQTNTKQQVKNQGLFSKNHAALMLNYNLTIKNTASNFFSQRTKTIVWP